jgi:hypothetical protein
MRTLPTAELCFGLDRAVHPEEVLVNAPLGAAYGPKPRRCLMVRAHFDRAARIIPVTRADIVRPCCGAPVTSSLRRTAQFGVLRIGYGDNIWAMGST